MNIFSSIDEFYLKPFRTLETILIQSSNKTRVLYVYNFEGNHFRVFDNVMEVLDFFYHGSEPEICFEDDVELDKYLSRVKL